MHSQPTIMADIVHHLLRVAAQRRCSGMLHCMRAALSTMLLVNVLVVSRGGLRMLLLYAIRWLMWPRSALDTCIHVTRPVFE